ncbi:MAG: carboxypeptidase-like regulatory domain-containing protein [Candidatus Diapherotrites archaeon]|nr:carboxypeptidase-like regulatory domain-containing protein [Candidatus Diapherotrites archaeon]
MADFLTELYKSWEDKYYNFLDKINEKIPIYNVVKPIDSVVPSFALLLILGIFLGLYVAYLGLSFVPAIGAENTITLHLQDEKGELVTGAEILLTSGGQQNHYTTNAFGEVKFKTKNGSLFLYEVNQEGFEVITKSITVDSDKTEVIELKALKPKELTKFVQVKDSRNKPVESAVVNFICSNPESRVPDRQYTDSKGEAKTIVAENCGLLSFAVKATGYKNLDSVEFTEEKDNQTISLQEDEKTTGTLRVRLTSEGKNLENIEAKLYKFNEQELGPIDKVFSSSGLVEFKNVFAGDYIVKVESSQGFTDAKTPLIVLKAGETKIQDMQLEKKVIGQIQLKIVDEKNKLPVKDALVKLMLGDEVKSEKKSDIEGKAIFDISEDLEYKAVVDQADYLVKIAFGLKKSESTQEVGLEKFTGANGGTLIAQVIDAKGKSVPNAKIALFDSDANKLSIYEEQTTDLNGEVAFTRVQNGTYKAFAFKESASGFSDPAFFDSRSAGKTKLRATLVIPDGVIEVLVKDEEGKAVSRARVTLFDELTGEVIGANFTDEEGKYSQKIQADSKVFTKVVFEKSIYFSPAVKVLPNTTSTVNAFIEKRPRPGKVQVKFLGLYKQAQQVTALDDGIQANVASGEEYTAKLRVTIPENNNYGEVGLHLRTGDKEILEKDGIFIKAINAPQTIVTKGTSFNENLGYLVDAKNASFDDSKWTEMLWRNPTPGIYEIEATIKVKENISLNEKLSIFYRAWGIQQNTRDKDPAVSVPKTHVFYDDVKEEIYQVGIPTLCTESFCFDAQLQDPAEKLVQSFSAGQEFSGKVFFEKD